MDGIACMGGHRPDGLRSVESAEGHCQTEGEGERGGAVASLNCSSAALPVSWWEIDVLEGGGGEERSGG